MVQTITDRIMKETEPHLEKFERFEQQAKHPAWVFPLRKAGLARFAELGYPTLKDEDWRFTNVAPITKLPFEPVFEPAANDSTCGAVGQFTFGRLAARRLEPHIAALYSFARIARDMAEAPAHEGARAQRLEDWRRQLRELGSRPPEHPAFAEKFVLLVHELHTLGGGAP